MTVRIFVVITLLVVVSASAGWQQSLSQSLSQTRAQEIAASFNKFKNAVKEKKGVRIEKYKDVRSEPVIKQNRSDYSGVYEVTDLGYVITIQVESDGRVHATGNESAPLSRSFRLEHARIDGALLSATKVYDNGASEKFEGVFMTRTERTSPTQTGVTTFGLGVVLSTPLEANGISWERLFYQRK
jgi:hypothetical protein